MQVIGCATPTIRFMISLILWISLIMHGTRQLEATWLMVVLAHKSTSQIHRCKWWLHMFS